MKKGYVIAFLLLLFAGTGYAQTAQDNALDNVRLNARVSELEHKLAEAEARLENQLVGLQEGLAENRREIEDRIGALDTNSDGTVDPGEGVDAVTRAAEQDPTLLMEPEFWASLIVLVITGLITTLRKRIMAGLHVFGRKEAAKRGYPSGTNYVAPVPVSEDGEPLVSEKEE